MINGELTICPNTTQTLSVEDIGFTSLAWYINGQLISTTNEVAYTYTVPGIYYLQLEATTVDCFYYQTESILVESITSFNPSFDFTTIHANFSAPSFTWYLDNQLLSNVSGESYSPVNSGVYTIIANTGDPCPPSAQLFVNLCPPVPDILGSEIACGFNPEFYYTPEDGYPIVEWYFEEAFITSGGDVLMAFANPGLYTISLIVGNEYCTNTNSITVEAFATPAVEVVDLNNGLLESTVIGSAYQWYFNGDPITNSNSQQITATQQGNYTVEVFFNTGCSSESDPIYVDLLGISEAQSTSFTWKLQHETLIVDKRMDNHDEILITIYAPDGKSMLTQTSTEHSFGLDLTGLSSGIYLATVKSESESIYVWRFALTR